MRGPLATAGSRDSGPHSLLAAAGGRFGRNLRGRRAFRVPVRRAVVVLVLRAVPALAGAIGRPFGFGTFTPVFSFGPTPTAFFEIDYLAHRSAFRFPRFSGGSLRRRRATGFADTATIL
jgi:hypothetical protein